MLLQNNISLKKYNSFGIDTIARDFYIFSNKDGLSEIVDTYQNQILDSHFILGGGSNILFTAQLLDTVVLKNEIKAFKRVLPPMSLNSPIHHALARNCSISSAVRVGLISRDQ